MSLMFNHLQIYDDRERALVGLADLLTTPLGWRGATHDPGAIRRVLLLRLERIGDLLMVLDAIRDARAVWPEGAIDLVVGSWNASRAALIPDLNRVEVADAPWLARARRGTSWPALLSQAHGGRRRQYDLVLNFEPDVRSNLLAWLSGGTRRVGYWTGGGGSFLTDA